MPSPNEPTVEVSLTLSELKSVVKSLSIGADQLAKKIQRRASDGNRANEIWNEYNEVMNAKQEMESVLVAVLRGDAS